MKYFKTLLLTVIASTLLISCFDDQDDEIGQTTDLEIENFIYNGMNAFYLYKADIPELQDGAFESQEDLNSYLSNFSEPEDLFYNGLLSDVDEFSFLVDDYIALEQQFSGITTNNGMRFGLVRYPDNPSNIFGYVRYVVPNSPAAQTNLQRGDIFNAIDGTQLTDSNFSSLLTPETYTLNLAQFDGQNVTSTDESISLTKLQLTENPVQVAETLNINGQNIGYLMYNSFIADFDTQLNAAFAQFQVDNVTDLVLDLRYNGGGSVRSAISLCSMITGQFNGEIITTEQWNDEIQQQLLANDPGRLENRFTDELRTGESINSLGLNRVYILTTSGTASASEFVINGLLPYIDVVQIGTNTTGKFQASITLYDSENLGRQGANPRHTYAIQPLVLKEVNSAGNTDFLDGLPADIEIFEDFSNLGQLGNPNERFLAQALMNIASFVPDTGDEDPIIGRSSSFYLEEVGESGMNSPLYQTMYLDTLKSEKQK